MARPRAFEEEDVLAKARDQFWLQGYASTSIQDLERATGLKRSSLYASFGDKRALFNRVLRRYQRDSQAYMRTVAASAKTFVEAARTMLEDAVERVCACPDRKGCFISNVTAELASSDEEAADFVALNRDAFVSILLPIAERDAAALSRCPRAACDYVFTCYSGLNLLGKSGATRQELLDVVDIALAGLKTG